MLFLLPSAEPMTRKDLSALLFECGALSLLALCTLFYSNYIPGTELAQQRSADVKRKREMMARGTQI